MKRLLYFGLVLSALLLAMVACTQPAEEPGMERTDLTFNSADPGGSWYPTAIALAGLWDSMQVPASYTHIAGGGASNALAIAEDKADLAISTGISVGDALAGNPPFEKSWSKSDINTIAAFLADTYAFVTFKDSGIETMADLAGKRISPSERGWTSESLAQRTLAAVGLSYDDMAAVEFVPSGDAINLLADGHVDAVFSGWDQEGDPGLTELTVTGEIRLIPIPDNILAELQKLNPGVSRAYYEAGSYNGIDQRVPACTSPTGLLARPELSEDLVYMMTKTMAENWESHMQPVLAGLKAVSPQQLARNMGTDFHPGAAKYYREVGWIQ
jgi:TRAP transporter TAXI family solute receptor